MVQHHSFPPFSTEGNLFASLEDAALPQTGQLLEGSICSLRSRFSPLRVDPHREGKGGKHKADRAASHENVPYHHNSVENKTISVLTIRVSQKACVLKYFLQYLSIGLGQWL